MPASYPSAIKTFTTLVDLADSVLASHQNDRALEITAIETELGTTPKGAYTDVAERLDAMSLTHNNSTITTSNLTCVEGNVYNCTIAGLTANRNAVLPAPSAAGKTIRLNVLDGDDTYVLIVIGDTGVTINGGSAATAWGRLYAKGESVTLESTSTTNWQVLADERRPFVPSFEVSQTPTAQSINTSTTTPVICNTEHVDIGAYHNVSDGKYTPLVAGTYEFSGALAVDAIADAKQVWVGFRKNGTTERWVGIAHSSHAGSTGAGGSQRFYMDGVDDYVEMIVWHNHGSSRSLYLGASNSAVHWGGMKMSDHDICGL